jgi:alpha-mannosidase
MKRLLVLLPCDGLERFELDRDDREAEQLLSAWSALWHPALLAGAEGLPDWLPATTPPPNPAGCLVIVPDCCNASLPGDWLAEINPAETCLLQGHADREQMLAAALKAPGVDARPVDADLAADFLALGYCHFIVELLTRKLRYASNLDMTGLQSAALAAAAAAMDGDSDTARRHLRSAFDRLHEAREYYYPTAARLLDLTLLAPGTFGEPLRGELTAADAKKPRNILATAETLDRLAKEDSDSFALLQKALSEKTAALIGGEWSESPLPMLGHEAIIARLQHGRAEYQRLLGVSPTVFGRRQFGLSPALPQILVRAGFSAAMHFTLDDGQFPAGKNSRVQWEGIDRTQIEALASIPLDAARPSAFLRLAERLGDAMGLDSAGTVVFAHWPGRVCRWYDDLRRIAAYSPVIGAFDGINAYFEATYLAGHRESYRPDQYRSPNPRQAVDKKQRDPISCWTRYYGRRARFDAAVGLRMLAAACSGKVKAEGECEKEDEDRRLELDIENSLEADGGAAAGVDRRLDELLQSRLADVGRSLAAHSSPRPLGEGAGVRAAGRSACRGRLLVNPLSFRQFADSGEVPAMGFSWIDASERATGSASASKHRWLGLRRTKPPLLAEPNLLRNEFCEVHFDPATGAIRAIRDYRGRNPRLAQQIALRRPVAADDESAYSIMAAERIEIVSAGPDVGEMLCQGRLVDRQGRRVAGFRQTTRLCRGSRVIEIIIELDAEQMPSGDPWLSYYAARFAWKDETLSIYRSANMANVPTELQRIEAPLWVELRRDAQRTAILGGGLPYHRRWGLRKLDTLLIVPGETCREFRLGVAIDAPHPAAAALGFLAPPLELPNAPCPAAPSGWLWHLDCRNVLATRWTPLPAETSAALGGFRARFLELDGRRTQAALRCFRPPATARKLDCGDGPAEELAIDGDRISFTIGPHQWLELEARFG